MNNSNRMINVFLFQKKLGEFDLTKSENEPSSFSFTKIFLKVFLKKKLKEKNAYHTIFINANLMIISFP